MAAGVSKKDDNVAGPTETPAQARKDAKEAENAVQKKAVSVLKNAVQQNLTKAIQVKATTGVNAT